MWGIKGKIGTINKVKNRSFFWEVIPWLDWG
jgi:hypothetical protein